MSEHDGDKPTSAGQTGQLGFDLNRLPANVKTTLKVEPDESPEDAQHRRSRENVILYFGLLIVTGAIAGSVYVAFGSASASADGRQEVGAVAVDLDGRRDDRLRHSKEVVHGW